MLREGWKKIEQTCHHEQYREGVGSPGTDAEEHKLLDQAKKPEHCGS